MIILIRGITFGFGRAIAQRLSADGHEVYGTFRKEPERLEGVTYIRCETLRLELRGTGVSVTAIEPEDLSTSFTARRTFAWILSLYYKL